MVTRAHPSPHVKRHLDRSRSDQPFLQDTFVLRTHTHTTLHVSSNRVHLYARHIRCGLIKLAKMCSYIDMDTEEARPYLTLPRTVDLLSSRSNQCMPKTATTTTSLKLRQSAVFTTPVTSPLLLERRHD